MSFLHKRESIGMEVDSRFRGNDTDEDCALIASYALLPKPFGLKKMGQFGHDRVVNIGQLGCNTVKSPAEELLFMRSAFQIWNCCRENDRIGECIGLKERFSRIGVELMLWKSETIVLHMIYMSRR